MNVLVLMSGGVDSSVAAARLLDGGHDVAAATLRLWGGSSDSGCCAASDVEDARRVAAQLGIPHYVFDDSELFEETVVGPYVAGYARGETPNPCVACNQHVKFGTALARARALGFDALATGHHARIAADDEGAPVVRRGVDRAKDQSYVLAGVAPAALSSTLLPVGHHTKEEVRAIARARGLRTAAKPESMDTCFVTSRERVAFVAARTRARPGAIVDLGGDHVARHDGIAGFTVGQRRGLGVAAGARRFVVDVDPATATVTIGAASDLLREVQPVRAWCWLAAHPGSSELVEVQVRAHGAPAPATVDDGAVRWCEPQPRVAPGQVVAVYRADRLLGGAIAA